MKNKPFLPDSFRLLWVEMLYGGEIFKNHEYRKKLTQGLKVSVRPNLCLYFTAHNVRKQTGTEEPLLKGFSVGGNKKTSTSSGVEEPIPSDFGQTLFK